ncbi:MAG: hypothetical protein ACYDEC_15120 [Bacteroidia bacterium]
MKKVIFTVGIASCLLFLGTKQAQAQSGQKYSTGLNSLSTGDALGSSNNMPLIIKTDNIIRAVFGAGGGLQINNLAGVGSRLLQTDSAGNILPFTWGNAQQVLYGNGVWGKLPPDVDLLTKDGNNNIYYNAGTVGIGTSTPNSIYKLDVLGDANINGNLFVGGGIVIQPEPTGTVVVPPPPPPGTKSLMIQAQEVQTAKLRTNALAVMGSATFTGGLQTNSLAGVGNRILQTDANGNISPMSSGTSSQVLFGDGTWQTLPRPQPTFWYGVTNNSITYNGTVGISNLMAGITFTPNPAYALDVNGDANVSGNLFVGQGVIIAQVDTGAPTPMPMSPPKDLQITAQKVHLQSALAVTGNAAFSGGIDAQTLTFKGTTAGMGYVLPGNPIPTATLNAGNLVLAANTNVWGGLNVASLATGSGFQQLFVDSFGNLSLGNNSNQRPVNPNTSIPACSTGNPAWLLGGNTMINKWGGTISGAFIGTCDASDFVMKTLGIERMRITAAGNVYVDIAYPKYTPFGNALFTVNGQMVAKDLFVEVTDWSDYVFKKDYKLIPLPEVEKYINEHGHLKNIPNAKEVETNGQNVGKLQVLQMEKIEELTLYVIEVNKKVEKLEKIEKENEALKKENKELKKNK